MAAPAHLLQLRKLKEEEKKIVDILAILRGQLTKLKVEELIISSKIRELKVKETCLHSPSAIEDIAKEIRPDSEEVNRESLNLSSKNDLQENVEEEEDEEEDEVTEIVINAVDDLSSFFTTFD